MPTSLRLLPSHHPLTTGHGHLLRRASSGKACSKAALAEVAAVLRPRAVLPGRTVIGQGGVQPLLYILHRGALKVCDEALSTDARRLSRRGGVQTDQRKSCGEQRQSCAEPRNSCIAGGNMQGAQRCSVTVSDQSSKAITLGGTACAQMSSSSSSSGGGGGGGGDGGAQPSRRTQFATDASINSRTQNGSGMMAAASDRISRRVSVAPQSVGKEISQFRILERPGMRSPKTPCVHDLRRATVLTFS